MEAAPFRHAGAARAAARAPTSAASPARSPAARCGRATRSACCPRDTRSAVERIVTYDGDLDAAVAGQAVTLTLADEIDASRGDMIAAADDPPGVADQFEATVVWMADDPMLPRAQLPDADRLAARHRDDRAAQVQAQRQLARAHRGDQARAQRDRRRRPRARPRRSRSTPTTRTARPAASSSSTGSRTTRSARACSASRCGARRTCTWQTVDVDKARARRRQGPDSRASCGSPACPAPASRRSPTSSRRELHRARLPHLHARRRQRPPRPQQGPRLHARPTASRTSAASPRSRG